MTLGRRSCPPMDLAAFRLEEIEDHRPGVFRHRTGLRAFVARLRQRWGDAWATANPEQFQRPSDRA